MSASPSKILVVDDCREDRYTYRRFLEQSKDLSYTILETKTGEEGLALAAPAIEGILRGSEHSTVLHGLEQDRKRQRIRSRRLESYEERSPDETSTFETLVPGLAEARRRRERRHRDSQVDPDDEEQVSSMLDLAEDEEIIYEEE